MKLFSAGRAGEEARLSWEADQFRVGPKEETRGTRGFPEGVNVGGHRIFRPSAFTEQLKHLDAVNIGAAGTFVIRRRITQTQLRIGIEFQSLEEFTLCASPVAVVDPEHGLHGVRLGKRLIVPPK